MSTKEKILDSALELFSNYGFDNVGVDAIAENVGIKGPSIYKHFKNKQDILNNLLEEIEKAYTENVAKNSKLPETKEELIHFTKGYISYTLHNQNIIRSRKLMNIEQFRNERLAKINTFHTLTMPVNLFSNIFEGFNKKGLLRYNQNVDLLAYEFVCPVGLLIQESDRNPKDSKRIEKKIIEFIDYFIEKNIK